MSLATSAPYFVSAAACFLITRSSRAASSVPAGRAQDRAWLAVCAMLVVLGILRPYEIHTIFGQMLRESAVTGGWYGERMQHQLDLLLGLGFVAAVLAGFLLLETRKWHMSTRLAALTAFYLCGPFILNLLSLHSLDALLNRRLMGVPLRWLTDLPALGLMVALALGYRLHARRQAALASEAR